MTYPPDEYMSQNDGKIIMEEYIKYIRTDNGSITKVVTTRRFYGDDDYVDSHEYIPIK